jgi:hypothetical protein
MAEEKLVTEGAVDSLKGENFVRVFVMSHGIFIVAESMDGFEKYYTGEFV